MLNHYHVQQDQHWRDQHPSDAPKQHPAPLHALWYSALLASFAYFGCFFFPSVSSVICISQSSVSERLQRPSTASRRSTPLLNCEDVEMKVRSRIQDCWRHIQRRCRQADPERTGEIDVDIFLGTCLISFHLSVTAHLNHKMLYRVPTVINNLHIVLNLLFIYLLLNYNDFL